MNFDDIKDAWNNDEENEKLRVPASIDQLKSAQLPVEKLRRGMKGEMYVQLFSLLIIGLVPQIIFLSPVFVVPFYTLYVAMLGVSAYYFFKLYVFYKSSGAVTLTSKESLYELYYEARLSIEMYKSYTYVLCPFGLVMGALLILSHRGAALTNLYDFAVANEQVALILSASLVTSLFSVFLVTEYWTKSSYGKYIRQIKSVLDEIKE
ncbi:hypothetical protein SAMN05660909_01588 [Chitinophaga terrae (ex Kim and Jung 2007)]|uniref:Uncharacterized protein n=1 Tax=Chitinophaga terrae (ex Kim and Jung 2007) TaxID=408074 RepID=A0A1H4ABG9_9BACT|nr:hypothetical protein [Chitinophaga terrae (ex Kim and Jung 2007)]MDQ0105901.1 hypothetical protein [Chitinophaga terrae (ex Kim and Jung 2007)]GEP90157.1 hypothetical protein CTE07_18020 [Chitinophaga terrae (ex Kim and Jung 2007)]SEA33349.1 hypothetical protein SAMN05660909_01588 [Chitinophaga terrae (ex Kim and Jung 2007)]